jgi:hypothetical protein
MGLAAPPVSPRPSQVSVAAQRKGPYAAGRIQITLGGFPSDGELVPADANYKLHRTAPSTAAEQHTR